MPERIVLDPDERRVIGVLIEKSLCTPQYYPLTVNALVSGSNQKSNRDPIVEYVEDDVEEALERLRQRGLATVIYPAGSRAPKWRQEMTSALELDGRGMAVIAELFLRGAQTTGELRARASRMKPIPDRGALEEVLEGLLERRPPLIVRLSPEGVARGVRVTHNFHAEEELAEIIAAEEAGAPPRRESGGSRPGSSQL
ncbi:MAG: DUF480 domain-containing protein, partial [Planctomycetota bacterium]